MGCSKTIVLSLAGLIVVFFFLLAMWIAPLSQVSAQTQYFLQQTFVQTYTGTMTGSSTTIGPCTSSVSTNCINDLGQAGHSILVLAHNCAVALAASGDGNNFVTLASVNSSNGAIAYATGFFPYLKLVVNPSANAGCNGLTYNVTYSGYQFPQNSIPESAYFSSTTVASPQILIEAGSIPGRWTLNGFECTNSAASIAFLQLFNSTSASLGPGSIFEVEIPAATSYTYSGQRLIGNTALAMGAATTLDGTTAVGTPLTCTVQGSTTASYLTGASGL